jgi:probable rRNA maturation factor
MTVRVAGPPRRRGVPRPDGRLLRVRARALLAALGQEEAELSVALVDDEAIAALNAAHRGRPRPTDVLSFSLLEGPHAERRGNLLGDVVIGVETAAREAKRRACALDDEIARLLVHGVLHLLGHDHEARQEARLMRAEERRLARLLAVSPAGRP